MENIFSFVKNFIYKYYIFMILIVFLMLIAFEFIFFSYRIEKISNKETELKNNSIVLETDKNNDEVLDYIYVDIKGMINKPGVYKLEEGSRINDLIKSAGGLKKGANTGYINLSKVLNDQDVIIINSDEEIGDALKDLNIKCEPCICNDLKNDACIENSNNKEDLTTENNSNLININTALLNELMSLNGIGEAKANAIIEYRNTNGNFEIINDIMNVDGISETLFNKIKENITV